MERWSRRAALLVFWGWNGLLCLVMGFGFGPEVLYDLLVGAWWGYVRYDVACVAVGLAALPVVCWALAALRFPADGGRLLTLLFGVELPLMVAALVRVFGLTVLSPGQTLGFVALGLGGITLLVTVCTGFSARTRWGQASRLAGHTIYLGPTLWLAAVLACLAPGAAWWSASVLWRELWRLGTPGGVGLFELMWLSLLLTVGGLWVGAPVAMVGLSLGTARGVWRASVQRLGARVAATVVLGVVSAGSLAVLAAARQPSGSEVLAWLEAGREADELLHHERWVQAGLLDAVLAERTRLGADDLDLAAAYAGDRWLWPLAPVVGPVWRAALAPWVYLPHHGSAHADLNEAVAQYERVYDASIWEEHRATLAAAFSGGWNWRQAQATVLEVGAQLVHLDEQHVEITEHGEHATVLVHDVMSNLTWLNQEVFVSFSLPESAAVSGVWLGATDDREQAFPYVVAPRGAARRVYEQQVRRSVDPALLEQVGPRQYRLRVFPVPARPGSWFDDEDFSTPAPPMHVWVQIEVMRGADGRWPLPETTEVRGLFWDRSTLRTLGEEVVEAEGWLPEPPPASGGSVGRGPAWARVGERWVRVERAADGALADPGSLLVLIDQSASMRKVREPLAATVEALRAWPGVRWRCARDEELVDCADFDAAQAVFAGNQRVEELLAELGEVQAAAVVVLTDGDDDQLGPSSLAGWSGPPLWLLHHGRLAKAYDDALGDALQTSGGGVVSSVEGLRRRLGGVSEDGWRFEESSAGGQEQTTLTPIAARQLVRRDMGAAALRELADEPALRQVHAMAVEHGVVTPWSSMIVLVNADQLAQLAVASEAGDAFERADLTPDAPNVFSTPEPGATVLTLGGLLALGLRRRRQQAAPTGCVAELAASR